MTGGAHGVSNLAPSGGGCGSRAEAGRGGGRAGGRVWTIGAGGPAPCARGPCFGKDKKEPRRPLETAWGRRIADRREGACGVGCRDVNGLISNFLQGFFNLII